jgi:hypothetical protein
MKLKKFIKILSRYNQDADIDVIVNHSSHPLEHKHIAYGGSDGCTIENSETVSIYINELNNNDETRLETIFSSRSL